MSLDLSKVVNQIHEMIALFADRRQARKEHVDRAIETLFKQSGNLDSLKKKIALSKTKTTWLVGEPVESLDLRVSLPRNPSDYIVLATDGSHIDVDRHHSTRCYLINIGSVMLEYGAKPEAHLDSQPIIYSEESELVIKSLDGLREVPVEGNLLGIKRSVEECRRLSEMMNGLPPERSALGLMDGSLIMWNLETYPEFVVESMLDKGFISYLEKIRRSSVNKRVAVASYISFPRSADVVNTLRVALCPREFVDSDRCSNCASRECSEVSGVYDRDLFAGLLKDGERSGIFISASKIQQRYGKHLVNFFYLRTNEEIARVEIPLWVAEDAAKVDLVQSLVVDQCRRGQGYPVALSEAHEKAVVTTIDRDNFWRMVDESLVEGHLPAIESEKNRSKRTKWI